VVTITIPILPCRDVDEILAFYKTIGFVKTYRQIRPNPYVVVKREGIELHFFGVQGFDPEKSMGTCSIKTDDVDGLYRSFVDSLRAGGGRVPTVGIPRLTRPRKRGNLVYGFSMVDPGGNWIRVASLRMKAEADPPGTKLQQGFEAAVTLGDSHGDPARAAEVLDTILARHESTPLAEKIPALVYRAELAVSLNDGAGALARLAEVRNAPLTEAERATLSRDLALVDEIEEEVTVRCKN
jgi:hypothetical protein